MSLKDSLKAIRKTGNHFDGWLAALDPEDRDAFLSAIDDRNSYSIAALIDVVRENGGRVGKETLTRLRRDRQR